METALATHRASSERGQAVVELAFVLPVLVLLVFGTLEVGRVFNAWIVVTQASREGARTAAVACVANPGCSASVQARVEQSLSGLSLLHARWSLSNGPYTSGSDVQVDVDYDVAIATPLIGALLGSNVITVHSDTTMRLE